MQNGTYVIKLLTNDDEITESIMVGEKEVEILGEVLIKVEKNTVIQIPSVGG